MRIAINTRLLIPNKLDGIGWFTYETVRRIIAQHPEHEFYLLYDRPTKYDFGENSKAIVLCPQARHPVLWYLFFEWSIPLALKRYKIDLFLSTDGYIPTRTNVPTLNVIHDINFAHSSGNLKPSHQRYMSHYFPIFAQQATRLATVSEFSRDDISNTYKIDFKKIDVVYNGAHNVYRPLTEAEKESARERHTQGFPYFIFVSTILKRKNLANLFVAFDQFKKGDKAGHKLVVVGAKVWWQDELKEAWDNLEHKKDVIFIGRADAQELAMLMGASSGLVYPSFFEGFGIPIIEAFSSETPVITSDATSMPEVAGDAALLINPHKPNEIASAMERIANDENLRGNLIAKGRQQRAKFSWERTSQLLWDSLMKTYKS